LVVDVRRFIFTHPLRVVVLLRRKCEVMAAVLETMDGLEQRGFWNHDFKAREINIALSIVKSEYQEEEYTGHMVNYQSTEICQTGR
jgi:hypothetical protein